jgi:hypothetical protein
MVVFMARIFLAQYLMFAMTAGPWLCCCSGERLFGGLFAPKHAQTNANRCCNHRATGGGHHVPGDNQHPKTPMPHDPCPCRDGVPDPIAISVANSSLNADFARPMTLSQDSLAGVSGATDPWHPPAENEGFAFASPLQNPRDILSVLQTLRC